MPTYTLLNAEEEARRDPRNFYLLSELARSEIPDGHWAQLAFLKKIPDAKPGERFFDFLWAQVISRDEDDGSYYGIIGDDASNSVATGVSVGDQVLFGPEHVFGIIEGELRK